MNAIQSRKVQEIVDRKPSFWVEYGTFIVFLFLCLVLVVLYFFLR